MVEKKLESRIKGIDISVSDKNIIVKSSVPLNILSSAVLNGGITKSKYIINHYVPKDYDHQMPEELLLQTAKKFGLDESCVGLMTAVKMENVIVENFESGEFKLTVIVTGGTTNSIQVGQQIEDEMKKNGTINIILITNANLNLSAMVTTSQVITEAKTMALLNLDIRSQYGGYATGTTTDSIIIACQEEGPKIKYAGTATMIGSKIGNLIKIAVKKAIIKRENKNSDRDIIIRLEERGIKITDLIETAMELYIPHPGIETKEKARISLEKNLNKFLKDPNVAILLMSAFRIQEDGEQGLIPMISKENFVKDPVYIVADEILGMAISNYIAGTRGIFEFYRFDSKKPGIIKKMGVFIDDIIGGLLAGVSSLIYSEGD
ncbi:MAG: phosphatidylglycerophosphatase A [Candidatus Helarchaeota archaeon]|nr:phosphatidylglycerophosphatase A [Candidatus Helarchaeota archaeon]